VQEARILETIRERERIVQELSHLQGVTVFPSRANFLLLRVANGPKVARALRENGGIVVRSLHQEEGPLAHCLRVTVGTKPENDAFLRSLRAVLTGR
jgi:histidinol-phosphate aminotransferase